MLVRPDGLKPSEGEAVLPGEASGIGLTREELTEQLWDRMQA